jgi:hypothetical protein
LSFVRNVETLYLSPAQLNLGKVKPQGTPTGMQGLRAQKKQMPSCSGMDTG